MKQLPSSLEGTSAETINNTVYGPAGVNGVNNWEVTMGNKYGKDLTTSTVVSRRKDCWQVYWRETSLTGLSELYKQAMQISAQSCHCICALHRFLEYY